MKKLGLALIILLILGVTAVVTWTIVNNYTKI